MRAALAFVLQNTSLKAGHMDAATIDSQQRARQSVNRTASASEFLDRTTRKTFSSKRPCLNPIPRWWTKFPADGNHRHSPGRIARPFLGIRANHGQSYGNLFRVSPRAGTSLCPARLGRATSRELENVMASAAISANSDFIDVNDLREPPAAAPPTRLVRANPGFGTCARTATCKLPSSAWLQYP